MHRFIRRAVTTAGATVGALALFTGTALAHECYIATKTTNGPKSANWFHITIADAATQFFGFEAACAEQVSAGENALRDAGLPLSVKVFLRHTLAENAPAKVTSDNKGLEHFGDGSTLADEAVGTFIGVASATACPTA
jgi:hypothetical protein